mmetsp:Transcript_47928/g.70969  ORF Transcript_47928/g.70969 Transcript_47928/m.70969 type:complete len:448 (+) Transcript_47928:97-1440(+)
MKLPKRTHVTLTLPPPPVQDPAPAQDLAPPSGNRGRRSLPLLFLSCLRPYTCPIVTVLILYTMLITGAIAYLIPLFIPVPGLTAEVNRVTVEVFHLKFANDALQSQISELNTERMRLKGEVKDLSESIANLATANNRLVTENENFAKSNDLLQSENANLETLQTILNTQNVEFQLLNRQLNHNSAIKQKQQADLQETEIDLIALADSLQLLSKNTEIALNNRTNLHNQLSFQHNALSEQSNELKSMETNLTTYIEDMIVENARFEQINANLSTIVDFVSSSGKGVTQSYTALTLFLETSIENNQRLLLNRMKFNMNAKVKNWKCGLKDEFPDATEDTVISIRGGGLYPEILNYLNNTVLSELCIDVSDFERYLQDWYNDENGSSNNTTNITLNELTFGLNFYSLEVFNYYFPDNSVVVGITEEEWAEADYQCRNFPPGKQFLLFPSR